MIMTYCDAPASRPGRRQALVPVRRLLALGILLALAPSEVRPADPPTLTSPHWASGQFEFTLNGQTNTSYRIEATTDYLNWNTVTTSTGASATRNISVPAPGIRSVYRAVRLGTPYFRYALLAAEAIDLNGQNLTADSFNSRDPLQSTGGAYDVTKAGDRGDAAAVRGVTNAPGVGNVVVAGTLRIGTGGATAIGPQGRVGDRTWIQAGNIGIQPGHLVNNLTFSPPVVTPPSPPGPTPGAGLVAGEFYEYLMDTGNYSLAALGLSSDQKMFVRGHATLHVSGGVTIAGSSSLVIATNASLRLLVGGANTSISMAGVTATRQAAQFQIYGLAGSTTVNLLGGPSFVGCVFAPNATLSLGTPAAGTPQLSGAFVARSVRLNSAMVLHFDEDLLTSGPSQ